MKSVHLWSAMLFLAALSVVGCRSTDTVPTATSTSHTSPVESPLPTATTAPPEQTIPAPGSDTGVVVGAVEVEELGDPMRGVQVFLGEPIGSDSGEPLFGLDPSSAPGAEADEQGRFVIPDVPPADYVIVLWSPVNSILARDPETGDPLLISVEAGEVVDVGQLSEPRP